MTSDDIVKTKICIRNEFNSPRDISVIRTGEGLGRAKVLLHPGEQIGTDDITVKLQGITLLSQKG